VVGQVIATVPYTAQGRLLTADKLLKLSTGLVAEQREIIAGMKSVQLSTYAAEKLLRVFESGLERAIQQQHVAALASESSWPIVT
jgi:hypothetical protein